MTRQKSAPPGGGSARVLRFEHSTLMRWANGAGLTREVARSPGGTGAYDWRVSVAVVESNGPFSPLRDTDRTILFCEGEHMALTVDRRRVDLARHVPFDFDGEADTHCEIGGGATRDVNIMTNRRTATSTSEVARVVGRLTYPADASHTVMVALTDKLKVAVEPHGIEAELMMFDALHLQGTVEVGCTGHGSLLITSFGGPSDLGRSNQSTGGCLPVRPKTALS